MSVSKTKAHVRQQKEKQVKGHKQPQSSSDRGDKTEDGPMPVGTLQKYTPVNAALPILGKLPLENNELSQVEALIRQAYGEKELSAEEVRAMAYSLEEYARLCYHLLFGEGEPSHQNG